MIGEEMMRAGEDRRREEMIEVGTRAMGKKGKREMREGSGDEEEERGEERMRQGRGKEKTGEKGERNGEEWRR